MPIRILSGIIGAILVIAVLVFNETFLWLINVIIASICVFSMLEICTVMRIKRAFFVTLPALVFVPIMPMIGNGLIWQIFFYIYTLFMMGVLVADRKTDLKTVAIVYMMALVITTSLSKIVQIRDFGGELGSFYVLITLALAWTSDTGAYFAGKCFGKNKLCPDISPKKTVEGVIGGVVTCVFSLIFISFIFNNFMFPHKHTINYPAIVTMGLVGSLISTLGDLCFSAVKRRCHVKDFGNVIPGHGGILDRFDSVIFVSPYVYIFINLIAII